ncbi:MAG: sugar phosphate isomerase/epimerase [Candidatus Heimdallarchaeum aukensis]|uniref:Sugar phosphate isomerase/epimerase n=1 Tax=Candidatus Heimdallarchaeum aukensis TaxID=2876573 RepID=A0A9Y1BIA4_9ARCH|nr:MAG: sugar phosphate isomerase/epimerase [Candidatus Heimdallarchaeum aukensis]
MVLIGQTLQAYKGLSTEQLLLFVKALGFESCEINPAGTSLNNVEKIISKVGKMKLTFHLPIQGIEGYDFSQEDKADQINNVISLINNYGEKLNLLLAVVHPPEGNGNIEVLVKNLKKLNIPIVLENVVWYSNEEFKEIYEKLKIELGDQLKGWLFDVAHSYLRNGRKHYLDILDLLPFSELEEIHLSDCLEGEDSHYAFGAGILPIDEILREIKERGYNKIIVNEIDAHPTIWDVIDSYRKVARTFKKKLYRKVTFRLAITKPIIQAKLKKNKII